MTRTTEEIFALIDGERNYQQKRWAGHKHPPASYLTYMWYYYRIMEEVDSTVDATEGTIGSGEHWRKARAAMRKFAALGVSCLEENGLYYSANADVNAEKFTTVRDSHPDRELIYSGVLFSMNSQDSFYGPPPNKEFSEYLTDIRSRLRQADNYAKGEEVLESILRLIVTAVRCMMEHGAPLRMSTRPCDVV